MAYYVAVDIGCLECGEGSAVLGIFKSEADAQETCDEHEVRQEQNWSGEHYIRVFKVPRLNTILRQEYSGMFNGASGG